jgi:hypothetical protein
MAATGHPAFFAPVLVPLFWLGGLIQRIGGVRSDDDDDDDDEENVEAQEKQRRG